MIKLRQFLFAAICWVVLSQIVWAQLTVTKAELNGITSVNANTPFTYIIEYSTPSTSENYTNLTICDVLPSSVEFLAISAATSDMTDLLYDPGTHTVCATFISPWNGGTGQFEIVVKFPGTIFDGTLVSNTATATSMEENFTTPPVDITAINPDYPLPILDSTHDAEKKGPIIITDGGLMTYTLNFGIGGNDPVTQYVVTDVFPTGFILGEITGNSFPNTNLDYNVYYKTNLNGTFTLFPGMPANTCCWERIPSPTLGMGEYITEVQFVYDNLPAGPGFTIDNHYGTDLIGVWDNSLPALNSGDIITNCFSCVATGSGAGTAGPACINSTYNNTPYSDLGFGKWQEDYNSDFSPGETIRFCIGFGDAWQNGTDFVNPTVGDLLPPELTFLGNIVISDDAGTAYADAGSPVPSFEAVPNFAGTGRTLLRWKWDSDPATPAAPFTFVRSGPVLRIITICFDTQLKDMPTGQFNNDVFIDVEGADPVGCAGYSRPNSSPLDVNDFDGDGNTTEEICQSYYNINIINPSGAALVSTKWVKGSLDNAYSRFPDVANTTPGGIADYQLNIKNIGSIDMTDIVVIDILPYVGDVGVIDILPRGSQWQPYLAAPITVPAGITVYYSTSYNPCRTELNYTVPGCDAVPNWTATPPADITTVHSLKFDFGSTVLQPNDSIILEWSMRAPIDAPDNGEIAWNSFGYIGTRMDNGNQLPPSEPLKVGIAIEPIQPAAYGDYVWFDSNHNGIQDEPTSQGLNGVTVELYADTNGNGISEPGAGDNLVSFTVTNNFNGNPGYYLFPNLAPGNYFAVFYVPVGYNVTNSGQGSDPTLDSDGTAGAVGGQSVMITPVTNLIASEDDRTWDLGVYCSNPTSTVAMTAPTCNGATPNNDGIVELTATTGTKYGFSVGATYSGPNFASAINVGALPIVIANNAAPAAQYTVRVFSGDGSCYYDQTVTVPTPTCGGTCSIIINSALRTSCDPADNSYDLEVNIGYANQPAGNITINVDGTDYTFTPDGTSPDVYTITNLPSNGVQDIDITASFVNNNTCSNTAIDAYDAPVSCSSCPKVAYWDMSNCQVGDLDQGGFAPTSSDACGTVSNFATSNTNNSCGDNGSDINGNMCWGPLTSPTFDPTAPETITWTVTYGADKTGTLSSLRLRHMYGLNCPGSAINDNNYPQQIGIRVLKDGTEIYNQTFSTPSVWTWTDIVLNSSYSGGAVYTFQVLPFDPAALGGNCSIYDIDEVEVYGCCALTPPACSVTVNSAVPTTCNPTTNTYGLDVSVTYASQPAGDITINVGGTNYTFTPDGTSPDTYTVTGLTANGTQDIDVTATFVGNAACTDDLIDAFDAPANCACDNVTDPGTIIGTQTFCGTSYDPSPINNVTLPSGGTGTIEYMWISAAYPAPIGSPDWSSIPGTNTDSYDPGTLTQTTCFRRCSRRVGCIPWVGETDAICITLYPPVDVTCSGTNVTTSGGNDGTANVTASGGTSPYAYLWTDGATTASISGKIAGTYAVTVTDDKGCTASCQRIITEPGAICNLTSAGLGSVSCNNNGTTPDATDDYITFTLNPTGTNIGTGYVVTVSSSSVTPTTGTYGAAANFQLQAGSAGGGTITVTVTDNTNSSCSIQANIIDPGDCSTPACPPVICVPVIVTKN